MIQQQKVMSCWRVWLTLMMCVLSPFSYGAESEQVGDGAIKVSLELEGGFKKGTLVETIAGPVVIESIQSGDKVLSCDHERGICMEGEVEATFSYVTDASVQLTIAGDDGEEEILQVARDHLFFDAQHEKWRRAVDLQEDDWLLASDFRRLHLKSVEVINEKSQETTGAELYNFAVKGLHNYYAGQSKVLVHNFNPLSWLSERVFHSGLTDATFLAGLGSLASLMVVKAPYGRHISQGWGATISNKLGWIIMELPSVVAFGSTFFMGEHSGEAAPQIMAGMWLTHYIYRTFIYPNLIKTKGKKMPVSLALTGAAFNTLNSYINARALSQFGEYPQGWLKDPRFLVGALVFAAGMAANIHSDQILINLRKPGENDYKIPRGGLFKYVSSPNYLGEMIEWLGWSIATSSKSGAAFAFYTAANLVPRALANHKWYREKFGDDYPKERKALVPVVL